MFLLEYLGENMSPLVTWMALLWFAVGVLAGRRSRTPVGLPLVRRGAGSETSTSPAEGVELYVGNLAFTLKERELEEAFEVHGTVLSARIIKSGYSGKSKGYGFVVMAQRAAAEAAVAALHGQPLRGRELAVNEARTRSRLP